MANLLPADKRQISLNVLPRREPFEILYRLNCDNLCADFREDLQFRFSWGITALIQRFAGRRSHNIALSNPSHRVGEFTVIISLVKMCHKSRLKTPYHNITKTC